MQRSESIGNLAASLVRVHAIIEPIVKDRQNPHFKNNYATLDAIMESIRGPLLSEGLAVVQGGGAPVSNMEGTVSGVAVETMLLHSSGEWISSTITLPLDKPSPQAVGSAVTYGRRYGVAAVLALTTEEDDDGNVATASTLNVTKKAEPVKQVGAVDEPACPKCSGPMWDNRLTKKSPNAPDWKCKDAPAARGAPGCEGVIWPPKDVTV